MEPAGHDTRHPAPAAEAAETIVARDTACLGCGYNLRTLTTTGSCPECGWAVARSIKGNLLRFAETHWVDSLTLGLKLVYYSLLAVVIAVATSIGLLALGAMIGAVGSVESTLVVIVTASLSLLISLALLAWPIATTAGWWLATTPEPSETAKRARQRTVLRITGVALVPVYILWVRHDLLGIQGPWRPWIIEAIALACFICLWVHLRAVVDHVSSIHRRCDPEDDRLRARSTLLPRRLRNYVRIVPTFALLLFGLSRFVAVQGGLPAGARGAPGFAWGSGMGYVLMSILLLVVYGNLVTTLRCIKPERAARALQDAIDEEKASPHSGQAGPSPPTVRS